MVVKRKCNEFFTMSTDFPLSGGEISSKKADELQFKVLAQGSIHL